MFRVIVYILLLLWASDVWVDQTNQPIVKEFPKSKDMMGNTVWYNPVTKHCENEQNLIIKCPEFIKKKK